MLLDTAGGSAADPRSAVIIDASTAMVAQEASMFGGGDVDSTTYLPPSTASQPITAPISTRMLPQQQHVQQSHQQQLLPPSSQTVVQPTRDSAQAPLRKLSVDLIKTYKQINEVG
uniref:Dual-specificity kinase n=1 Tax=Plectus sambesii TaxID=2011161 RepID=A0A914XT52_9BILA